MNVGRPHILTVNGGSSSIKFAVFEGGEPIRRILHGGVDRIGLPGAALRVEGPARDDILTRSVTASDHAAAAGVLIDCIEERIGRDRLAAAGHRIVHGGTTIFRPSKSGPRDDRAVARADAIRSHASAGRDSR